MGVIICITCGLEYERKNIGVAVEAMTTTGPYQLYSADKLSCPGCNNSIAIPADKPIAWAHQKEIYPSMRFNYAQHQKLLVSFWRSKKEKQEYAANHQPE